MCCTLYFKSSLYNLITALKRGTQYSCFPRQVGVLCPLYPPTRSRLRCLGRGQDAREHRGQAGRREARGQQRGRDPEGAGQQRHRGDPDPLHLRLLEPLSLGAPVLKPDLDLELENCVREEEKSVRRAVCWHFECQLYFISAPFAQIVTRSPPGSRRVSGPH